MAVSADAMQVYEGLPILTGAADAAEQAQLEHRLIGFVPIERDVLAPARSPSMRTHEIDGLLAQGRRPIVVGGTGLYLRAALADLDLRPPRRPGHPAAARERAVERAPRRAARGLAAIAPTDRQRIIRAHELLDAGHEPTAAGRAPSSCGPTHTRHPTLLAALVMDRARCARPSTRASTRCSPPEHDRRSNTRTRPVPRHRPPALGFQQLLDGDVEAMKTATRRYAKRQLTWLRKLPEAHLVD